jgi:hypothetical protein
MSASILIMLPRAESLPRAQPLQQSGPSAPALAGQLRTPTDRQLEQAIIDILQARKEGATC